jgi:hypothetical protein
MKRKFARDFKRGKKKKIGQRMVLHVADPQYERLQECARLCRMSSVEDMASHLLMIAIEIFEGSHDENKKEFGLTFVHPPDCDCCN